MCEYNCASELSVVGLMSGLQKIALIFLFSNFFVLLEYPA